MDSFITFHCSIQKEYKVPYNISDLYNNSSVESGPTRVKAMELGTVSGIMIIFFVQVLLSSEYKSSGYIKRLLSKMFTIKNISRTVVLTFIVLILPITVLFLLLTLVYKVICSVIIIRKDKYFVGFLDSFDVFWSLEDDNTKSIINVVGVIESDTPYALANNIKEKLKNIIPKNGSEKIFYRRNEKYGFYYWRKYSLIDMDQYVDIIDLPDQSGCSKGADLEYLMSDLQNQSLPYEDEGLFKILITRQRVGNQSNTRGDYGIIFRIHHSVGDGVALIEFLCQTFTDKTDGSPISMFSVPESNNHDSASASNILVLMQKLLQMPLCFVDGIIRTPDDNALHGPCLIGKKVFKWTETDENLLAMIKDIKENVNQINFSDILMTALSSGLKDFLSEKVAPVPDDIAVILPVRFPKTSNHNVMMKNDFSVTILDVPVKDGGNVDEIRDRCRTLRKSADPLTNYYFLNLVCSVLPRSILEPLLTSRQATMVFSNMPGPATLHLCGGNQLKSLVFFVPLKGNTGLGVTALCYGGVLRFAAVADEALVSSSEDLATILNGMVKEIARLHARYVK